MTTSNSTCNVIECSATPFTEAEIVSKVVRLVPLYFGIGSVVATEVRSHGTARTDIAVICESELIAIEVKRLDWRRVVGQAFLNRLCADRSYVAVWGEDG